MNTCLLRHTAVAVPTGHCYGRTDVPLAATFDADAAVLAARLPPGNLHIVSSPSIRCRSLASRLSATVAIDDRLRELDFGEWEMRPWDVIPREQLEVWAKDFVNNRPPGGESFAELQARSYAALSDAKSAAAGQPLLLCTHAGVIRALLATARGLPLDDAFSIRVDFGSLHELTNP